MTDEFYMFRALELAREALDNGEVPVGCVIVWEDGRIIGEGRNRREKDKDALAILNARIPELHYAAKDPAMGACGSVLNLFEERFGHHPRIFRGPLEAECAQLLSSFFSQTRQRSSQI